MNASDPGRDRTAADLTRQLPRPPERDLPAGRHQRLKEHLMSEFELASEPRRSRPARPPARRRPARRRVLATGAVAGIAAIAAAAALVTSALTGPPAGPGRAGVPYSHLTAAQLLDQVARTAARRPDPQIRPDQWEYTKTAYAAASFSTTGQVTAPLGKLRHRQDWTSPRGSCFPGIADDPANGLDHVNAGDGDAHPCRNVAGFDNPTWAWLQSLPVDPQTLLARLRQFDRGYAGRAQDAAVFTSIGDLFFAGFVPAQLSAALYRAAALIPGTTVDLHATDALGRPCVGVAFRGDPRYPTQEWLFARPTLRWVGERGVLASGQVSSVTTVVQRAVVSKLGQLPPG